MYSAAAHLDASSSLFDVTEARKAGKAGGRAGLAFSPNTLMHPSLFDVPWSGRAGETRQASAGQGICHVCGRWHIKSNGFVELNAVPI